MPASQRFGASLRKSAVSSSDVARRFAGDSAPADNFEIDEASDRDRLSVAMVVIPLVALVAIAAVAVWMST